jgi:ATP-dependent Clp protease adaptor protein ClpS
MLNDPRTFECASGYPEKVSHRRIVSYDRPEAGTSTTSWEDNDVLTASDDPCSLIVWNDEVNTFEWVIETLVDVCGHSIEQAEQCAMLIHTKGKYAVKRGSYEELKPLCDAITDRGIGATVEMLSES